MAGKFEIHRDGSESFRFRLADADGNTVAISPYFKHISGVVAGINAMRENAATGIVVDLRKPQS